MYIECFTVKIFQSQDIASIFFSNFNYKSNYFTIGFMQ